MFDDEFRRVDVEDANDDSLDFSGLEPADMFVSDYDEHRAAPRWVYVLMLLLTLLLIAAILITTYVPDFRILSDPVIRATPTLLPQI